MLTRGWRTLVLTGTQVSDSGLKHLTPLTNLSGLHLAETRVGDAGIMHLQTLTHLAHLDLSRTRVTNAGLAGLGEAAGTFLVSI